MTASREEAVTALIIDASGAKSGAAEFVAAAEKVKAANGGVVDANDAQVKTQQRVVEALGRTTRAVDALEKKYAPLSATVTQFARDEDKLNKIISRGGAESERARKSLEALRKEREKFNKVSQGGAARPSGITANQRVQLGYQANDIFAQASVGTNPLIIAAQQGPQITQIFGGLKNTLALIPGPAKIAAAAIIGIGTAAALVGSRMAEISSETRKLDALASALNPKYKGMADQLRAETLATAKRGTSRGEAAAVTETLLRARNLPMELRKDVAGLSVDLAAALGTKPAQAAEQLAEALSRGAAGIKDLDDKINFLTPAQRENITLLDEQGRRAEALAVAVGALGAKLGGTALAIKGEWATAFEDVGKSWDDMLERMAKSSALARVRDSIVSTTKDVIEQTGREIEFIASGGQTPLFRGADGPEQGVTAPAGTAKPLQLSAADLDALTRAVIAEAGGEGAAGQAAVARVILNRVQAGNFGNGVQGVVNAPKQFEPVGRAGGDWRNLPEPTAAQRDAVRKMAEGAANGEADPTGGALFFLNRQIAAKRGTDFGAGNRTQTAEIGGHTFYKEFGKGGGAAEERSPDAIKRIQDAAHATNLETEALKGNAAQRQIAVAVRQAEEAERAKPGSDNESIKAAGQQAALKVTRDMALAVRDQTESVDLNTRSILAQADAYAKSTAAGMQAEAQAQAAAEALQNPAVDQDARAKQLLRDKAAGGLLRGVQGNTQLAEGNASLRDVAAAAKFGPAAEAAALRAADAALAYRDAIAAAEAVGDTKVVERLERERDVTVELTADREKYNRERSAAQDERAYKDDLEGLQLEMSLIGATNEVRLREIGLLQLRQKLIAQNYTGQELEDELARQSANVTNLARMTDQADHAQLAFDDLKDGAKEAFGAIGGALEDVILKGGSFSDVIKGLEKDLLALGTKMLVTKPLENWFDNGGFGSMLGMLGGGAGGMLGGAATSGGGGMLAGAGDWLSSMFAGVFHTGGVVGSGGGTQRDVPAHVFANAPKFHTGGLVSGEVPAILQEGEEVLTARDPRHRKNGGKRMDRGGHTINVHISTPNAESFHKSQGQTAAALARGLNMANRRHG